MLVVRLTLVHWLCPKYRGSRQEVPPQGEMKLFLHKQNLIITNEPFPWLGLRDYTIPTRHL